MVSLSDMQARVASHFDRLDLPSWPDPHPDMASPRGGGVPADHLSGVVVERQPDCGCDARDSGSSDLLHAIDATVGAVVGAVVGGPYVVLTGRTWHASGIREGGQVSSEGAPGSHEVMDLCRRLADGAAVTLPRGTDAFVGRSWLR